MIPDIRLRFLPFSRKGLIIQISPETIEIATNQPPNVRHGLTKGDWDLSSLVPISGARPIQIETTYQMFLEGRCYEQTPQFKVMTAAIDNGNFAKTPSTICGAYWCRSHEEVHEYFRRLYQAFEDIRDHGYKIQTELIGYDSRAKAGDEIQIFITRDGQRVLGRGGTHRLVIAKILALPCVPVCIRGAHPIWWRSILESTHKTNIEELVMLGLSQNKE